MFFSRSDIKQAKKKRPEILTHPNIPKPLHGLNPRGLLGKHWWDTVRLKAQKDYGFCCASCGVPKAEAKKHAWLEGHEYWDINYMTGICEVIEIVPLCHYCHNFIHSGRLKMLGVSKVKTTEEIVEILEDGFRLLKDNKLQCFPATLALAKELGAKTFGVTGYSLTTNPELLWTDYKVKLEGKLYGSKFKSYEEWSQHYRK
jgi:hypothetical protein